MALSAEITEEGKKSHVFV